MLLELGLTGLVGVLTCFIYNLLSASRFRARLYSLECDLADLQDRHLSAVRRASIKKRWDGDEQTDLLLEQAVAQAATPKPVGWKKWRSSDQSENSSAAQSPKLPNQS